MEIELEELSKTNKLTDKQKLFCEYYIGEAHYNATVAYKMAYGDKDENGKPKSRGAFSSCGTRLLGYDKIKAYINTLQEQHRDELTLGKFLEMTQAVYNASLKGNKVIRFNPISGKLEDTGERQVDTKGANGALEIMAKALGYNVVVQKVDANVNAKVSAKDLAKELMADD